MTLDMAAVGRLVAQMGRDLAGAARQEDERLQLALATLRERAQDVEQLNARAAGGGFVGLAAGLVDPLDLHVPLPPLPPEYTVVASDGSLIEPDRHGAAYYYLINIGSVVLRYGQRPKAVLHSAPAMGYRPEDLYLALGEREVPLEGGVLRVKRAVAETERLAELLIAEEPGPPRLGLQDGTLILWMPEGHGINEAQLRAALLPPFLAALGRLRALGIPVASYVSRPRSAEVINALRLAICPYPTVDCRGHCAERSRQRPAPCDVIDGLTDRRLLGALPLAEGQRSARFFSRSRAMEQYRADRVYFCYVNVGAETARLEVPEWVAQDPDKLDLIHAAVYDQCRRGGGYPRALTEAHEKAVIGVGERQQCERLVETALARHHVRSTPSQKQQSKRIRGV